MPCKKKRKPGCCEEPESWPQAGNEQSERLGRGPDQMISSNRKIMALATPEDVVNTENGAVNAVLVMGGRGCDYELWTCQAGNAGSLTVSSPFPFLHPHLLHPIKRTQVDSGGLIPPVPQSSGQRRFESACATAGQWWFESPCTRTTIVEGGG